MMSKVLAIFVGAALLLGSVSAALGEPFVAEVKSQSARLRAGGSMAHHTVAKIPSGTKLVVKKRLGDWYVVRIPKNIPVYISAKWVRLESDDTGVVAGDRVNLRATPDTKYGALGVSYRGTVVKVLGKSNGWFKIVPPDTAYGWMYKTQLTRIGNLAEHGDVDAPAYQALQKKDEEKKASAANYALAEALMAKADEAAYAGNLDMAIGLLEEVCKKAPGT
ncbi:MAG: SH3 domain-containing protein, partial [Planctomycetota bacterium]